MNSKDLAFVCCLLFVGLSSGCVSAAFAQQATTDSRIHLYQVSARDPQTGWKQIGFIDKAGKQVISYERLPITIVAASEFREERAVVYARVMRRNEATEYPGTIAGYMDQTGAIVIKPQFDVARNFNEGLAYVEVDSANFKGFINREGQRVITVRANQAKDFHEGLAAAEASDKKKWGYIDRSGRWLVKPQYDFADDFSEGLAGVVNNGKYGFINKRGAMVIPARFGVRNSGRHPQLMVSSGRFKDGLAAVLVDRLFGYINRQGALVVPPRFLRAQEFSEGLAWVVTDDPANNRRHKVGWIDKSGRWVVTGVPNHVDFSAYPQIATYISDLLDWRYSEGMAPFFVYKDGRTHWGYMDRSGNAVILPRELNRVGPFIGGIAWVEIKDYGMSQDYGYIDKQGRFIWHSQKQNLRDLP